MAFKQPVIMKHIIIIAIGTLLCCCNNSLYTNIKIVYDDPEILYIREPFATDIVHRYKRDSISAFSELNIKNRRIIKRIAAQVERCNRAVPLRYFETPYTPIRHKIAFDEEDSVWVEHFDVANDINARIMVVAYGWHNDTIYLSYDKYKPIRVNNKVIKQDTLLSEMILSLIPL